MSNRQTILSGGIAALAVVTSFSAEAWAVGEGTAGFPNWAERALHELSNRARVDPQVELAPCGPDCAEIACYTPMPPLRYRYELNRAARFHSDEMVKQSFFAHSSQCTVVSNINMLYPAQCDGSASCACVGGMSTCNPTCTTTSQRVNLFNANYSGEIIASSANPVTSFYLWLFEDAMGNPACMFTQDNGHRWLILKSTAAVGFGVAGRATGDFGSGGGTTPKVPSGSHWPRQAATVEAWANWYDTAGPQSAAINVDGQCTTMQLGRGTQTNGAWSAMVSNVGTGCHRYYFVFTDSNDVEVTFPTTGSLGIGPAGSCEDWNTQRPQSCSTCTPQCAGKECGDDTCGGVCGMCAGNELCVAGQCIPIGGSSSASSSSSAVSSSSSGTSSSSSSGTSSSSTGASSSSSTGASSSASASSSSTGASSSASASSGAGTGGASTASSGTGGSSNTGAGGASSTTGAGGSSGTAMTNSSNTSAAATGAGGVSGTGTGSGQGGLGGGGSSGGDSSDEAACGCRTVGGGAGNPIGLLGLGLLIALVSRRRR